MRKGLLDIFSEDALREMNEDLGFYGGKKMNNVKMGIGMETLWLVSQINNQMKEKRKNNPKNLIKTLDLLDSFYDVNILTFKTIIDIKNVSLGKNYVRKCCYYAIFRSYSNDIDLVQNLEEMHDESPPKLSALKRKALRK